MNTKHEATGPDARERELKSAQRLGLLLVAVLASVLTLAGCGAQSGQNASSDTQAQAAQSANQAVAASVSTPAPASVPASTPTELKPSAPEAAAPDIVASVEDTLVTPGAAIEISVHGTPDVSEMALSDGINDSQALVYDASTNLWHVNYRVPLRPRQERIGLSVTARNSATHWRRVWLFLHVTSEAPEVKVDSTATKSGS